MRWGLPRRTSTSRKLKVCHWVHSSFVRQGENNSCLSKYCRRWMTWSWKWIQAKLSTQKRKQNLWIEILPIRSLQAWIRWLGLLRQRFFLLWNRQTTTLKPGGFLWLGISLREPNCSLINSSRRDEDGKKAYLDTFGEEKKEVNVWLVYHNNQQKCFTTHLIILDFLKVLFE